MSVTILIGDARKRLRDLSDASVHCCVTSPPYFRLRSYLRDDHPSKHLEMGLEATPDEYVAGMVAVFREVRRVLRKDGTLWLNIGESSAGSWGSQGHRATPATMSRNQTANHPKRASSTGSVRGFGCKPKDLIGIPWMLAFALRADGWFLRQDIIWSKPNPMPEPVKDRCTKAHEYLFLLSKSAKYHFDNAAISERSVCERGPGNKMPYVVEGERTGENSNKGGSIHKIGKRETRNKRSVWTVATQPFSEAHFATFPPALIEPCILAGCPVGGTVLDPFGGSGTTGMVAQKLGRSAVLIELNDDYKPMAERRIRNGDVGLPLGSVA